ncbi:MAG: Gfo/Idh/MocA family protein [Anaerolineae bacterium]|jgi:predicted dehydrogenase
MYTVGIIGARRGLSLASAFALQPDCRVTSVCDPRQDRLSAFTERFPDAQGFGTVEDMLRQPPDVVVVASPVPLHRDHTLAALEAGAHVLQEVVLADTVAHCQDIVQAVQTHPKQKFMLAENCCYWAHVMSWREFYAQGRIGQLMYAEAEYVHDVRFLLRDEAGRPTWRASLPPIHYCSHSLGPLLAITGERCLSVTALHTGSRLSSDLGTLDMEVALLHTQSGAAIKLMIGFGVVREPAFHYYSLYGTKGCLETSRPPAALATHAYLEEVPHLQGMMTLPLNTDVPGARTVAGGHGTAEFLMVQDFMRAVREDREPPLGIEQAVDMCLPGLMAHESALRGGVPVEIPQLI